MQSIGGIRELSAQELAMLGIQDVAYVKTTSVDGVLGYAIHTANGTQVALMPNRELAFAVVRQNDLEPVSVH